jgi:UDP-N-acetylmuramate dehydrogenase
MNASGGIVASTYSIFNCRQCSLELMLLEENRPLGPFTTFGIGGPARWFLTAECEDEIAEAAAWAQERGIALFVLGGGSNLLVADAGFNGLVLRVGLQGIEAHRNHGGINEERQVYRAAAGEDWDHFVQRTVEDNCAGLECLAGIPGTVGGTPVQNVGAYGQEVASTIRSVRVFDLKENAFVEFVGSECGFAYRRSRFNTVDRNRYVVTRVDYTLIEGGAPTLRYGDLQRAFPAGARASLAEVAVAVRRIRNAKGMLLVVGDPDCRSAGSFFKNPIIDDAQVRRVETVSGEVPPRFASGLEPDDASRVKLPAAWLIERAGFRKGYTRGSAGVSSRHTLALINRGGAKATDIMALASEIRSAVENRFGIHLEMEPVLLGFS